MEDLKDIASKTERKLDSQAHEFNQLRDRVLVLAGYAIALLTVVFSYWSNIQQPFTYMVMGAFIVSIISIGILIYAAFSNPLSRGMNTELLEEIVENNERSKDDYYLNEIAYNLDSFRDNMPLLKKLQWKLNAGLTAQTVVTILTGIAIYLNNINHG